MLVSFLYFSASAGIGKTTLVNNIHINPYHLADSAMFNLTFREGEKKYLARVDTALRKELCDRFTLEQQSKGSNQYKEIVYDNFNRIHELAKRGRFPGEQLIGVNEYLENAFVFATLKHYPYSYKKLEAYLWEAVRYGEAQPMAVLYLYGFNQTRTSILYHAIRPPEPDTTFKKAYNIPFGHSSSDTTTVDRNRKAAWLISTVVETKLHKIARNTALTTSSDISPFSTSPLYNFRTPSNTSILSLIIKLLTPPPRHLFGSAVSICIKRLTLCRSKLLSQHHYLSV